VVVGPSASVTTVAKAVTPQVTPEQAQKVVLVGNIAKFSLVLREPGEGLSLQNQAHDG
jgi:Flp pilus assembly protein CpaB